MNYDHLTPEQQRAIANGIKKRDVPAKVDPALAAAWEADHFAHAQLLAAASDPDEKKVHQEAMDTIEKALAKK